MIKLKNKPLSCKDCPFACTSERYVRENGEIKMRESIRCGAKMDIADIENCPIAQI